MTNSDNNSSLVIEFMTNSSLKNKTVFLSIILTYVLLT